MKTRQAVGMAFCIAAAGLTTMLLGAPPIVSLIITFALIGTALLIG